MSKQSNIRNSVKTGKKIPLNLYTERNVDSNFANFIILKLNLKQEVVASKKINILLYNLIIIDNN